MIRPAKLVKAMKPYALADLPRSKFTLALNESRWPPSPKAESAGKLSICKASLYPDPNWQKLRAAIAKVHRLDPESILCGSGSMELIDCTVRAFADSGDVVLGSQYGYLFLGTVCQRAGARLKTVPEQDYTVSVDALLKAANAKTRIVFICNPGNPTGTRIDYEEIARLRDGLPRETLLVIDQAYAEYDGLDHSKVFALAERGDTVILRTFSKAYALAGIRVGWGVFPAAIVTEVRKLLNPNNVTSVSQAIAVAAMRDQKHMKSNVFQAATAREYISRHLLDCGFALPRSYANFVLVPFADAETAQLAESALKSGGLPPRNMAGYGLAHCLRITLGDVRAMARVKTILQKLVQKSNGKRR